jgi:hypothetical protein
VKIVEDFLAKLNMVSLPHSILGCLHIHGFLFLLDFPRGTNEAYLSLCKDDLICEKNINELL